jgi:soluble lytic murein transglycosylase-like protein
MPFSLVHFAIPLVLILSGCASYKPNTDVTASDLAITIAKVDLPPPVQEPDPNLASATTADDMLPERPAPESAHGCRRAAAAAERSNALPPGLLTAIAGAESGMHPTALRVAGRGIYPATKGEARVIAKQALGRSQSVMAGCMQVNLQVHDPRGELWALEPDKAANWAADYLTTLHDRLGSWRSAISVYGGDSGRSYARRIARRLDAGLPDEVAEAP